MLCQAVFLLLFIGINVFAIPLKHHRKYFVKQQVKLHPKSDLEAIEQLVQESTELENGLRNLKLNLTEYREQVWNLTAEEQTALMQTVSSLVDAQRRLTMERIREERQRQKENLENALSQLQATIDEQRRYLREHRARQIEEFRRVNEEILRARQTLTQEGN